MNDKLVLKTMEEMYALLKLAEIKVNTLKQENAEIKASRDSVKAEAVMECMDILRDNDICGFRDAIHLLDYYLLTLTQGKDNNGGDV